MSNIRIFKLFVFKNFDIFNTNIVCYVVKYNIQENHANVDEIIINANQLHPHISWKSDMLRQLYCNYKD